MSEHLIYHWKHGWIPLTHAAALSKAHGNSKAADRYVPGSSQHESMATHGKSARQIHATLGAHADVTHPVGSHVIARQPGIDLATRGVVMGHKGGMVQVAHKDRRGATVVGTFNPHHVTPAEAPTRPASTPAEVAGLNHGDKARVSGIDEYGRPMTFAGTVTGQPTNVKIKEHRNAKPVPHIAVQMHNGSDPSGMDATARTTVYVPNPSEPSSHSPTTGTPASAPQTPRDAFKMGGPELKQHATNGSVVAQAEIDRRALKRSGGKSAPAPAAKPAARPVAAKPPVIPPPAKAPEAPSDPRAAALAQWEAENARIAPTGHTIHSRVGYVTGDNQVRGSHAQRDAAGNLAGSVFENRGGTFDARRPLGARGAKRDLGAFATRAEAHQALADAHQNAADAKAKKEAAAARKHATATPVGAFTPHIPQSDGTPRGDAAAAKIKQSFKLNNHTVHIEAPMTKDQTKAFLDDVHSVLSESGQLDATTGITFHVPTGDKRFRAGRRGTTGGYVRRGQNTIFINPKVANGELSEQFGSSSSFMPGAKNTTGTRYTITHELGHILDHQNHHTYETQFLGSHMVEYDNNRGDVSELQRQHNNDLSRYGRTNIAESYAEAYAQWIHGGPGSNAAADAYAAKFGWVIPKWYREGRSRA